MGQSIPSMHCEVKISPANVERKTQINIRNVSSKRKSLKKDVKRRQLTLSQHILVPGSVFILSAYQLCHTKMSHSAVHSLCTVRFALYI